ncbi:MAG: hypothetical protein BWY74_00457 [Firmicutes bacterium ADurb.Bin419]|nr:MAG: hypothetical protein BWY74_00457 [Firmicutes bacterium ADurb.Bin419]
MTVEQLLSIDKNNMKEASINIPKDDLAQLVEWLAEKDDKIRYQAFLLLQQRSQELDDVYPYWDTFRLKLKSDNSYQRSIGVMLIAENVKWDKDERITETIDEYLLLLYDEKPITVRQCIQSLCKVVKYNSRLHMKIANSIMSLDIPSIRQTMQKLVLTDILSVLAIIRSYKTSDEIEDYIFKAISGGVLDKKAIKQVEIMMGL